MKDDIILKKDELIKEKDDIILKLKNDINTLNLKLNDKEVTMVNLI